ncbi:ABC transporter G family member 22-like [Haliotis rufescens]|uniref:ABC transporter G family member 22-like n=1 Tax=Haliotis rufescens TaxID=6454 RepID=UPI00201ED1B6|nr:ABC transporter G family member 22-like [Haliotis rufescens]XP_048252428.1 ABC transporter G family member 22-like [Haliotis rufescens]
MKLTRSEPLEFLFKDLEVKIESNTILDRVSGVVHNGEILAVMGPSGSGKTTMLNTIAGRTTAQSGEITVNQQKLTKLLRQRMCYVLQEDLFFSKLTLWETLYFAAMIHLPDKMPRSEKLSRIDQIIDALDLEDCKNTAIGDQAQRGLSGGEKKRASIACQLLTDPDIMLLDEPTSGLDSSTAYTLMQLLKKYTAESNKAIIVTIHQPASQIFHMFTRLLLLAKGQVAYFGAAEKTLDFFEGVGLMCEPHYNPADFILETVKKDEATLQTILKAAENKRFTEDWPLELRWNTNDRNKTSGADSPSMLYEFEADNSEPQNGFIPGGNTHDVTKSACVAINYTKRDLEDGVDVECVKTDVFSPESMSRWPTCFWTQYKMLNWRTFKQSRGRILSKYAISNALVLAIVVGLLWFQMERTHKTIRDRMGMIFFTVIFWGLSPVFDGITSFPSERPIILKERAAGSYRLSAYYLAKMTSELPLVIILPSVATTIIYWMAGMKGVAEFFATMGIIILNALNGQGIGLLIGAWIWNMQLALTFTSTSMLTMLLLGGFYTTQFPPWLFWARYVSIFSHPFSAVCILEFSDTPPIPCANVTVTEYPRCGQNGTEFITAEMLLIDSGTKLPMYLYVLALLIFTIMFRIVGYWVLRFRTKPH